METIGASEYFALCDNFVSTLDCLYIRVSVYFTLNDNSGTLHFNQSEYFERLIENSYWLKGGDNVIITLILGARNTQNLLVCRTGLNVERSTLWSVGV